MRSAVNFLSCVLYSCIDSWFKIIIRPAAVPFLSCIVVVRIIISHLVLHTMLPLIVYKQGENIAALNIVSAPESPTSASSSSSSVTQQSRMPIPLTSDDYASNIPVSTIASLPTIDLAKIVERSSRLSSLSCRKKERQWLR